MTELKLLKTPDCPHCNRCLKLIEKIKKDFPKLKVKVVNILEHPELIEEYRTMSVPAIIINGKLEFVGLPKEKKLRKKLMDLK